MKKIQRYISLVLILFSVTYFEHLRNSEPNIYVTTETEKIALENKNTSEHVLPHYKNHSNTSSNEAYETELMNISAYSPDNSKKNKKEQIISSSGSFIIEKQIKNSRSSGNANSSQFYAGLIRKNTHISNNISTKSAYTSNFKKDIPLVVMLEDAPENSFISPGDAGTQKLPHELPMPDGILFFLFLSLIYSYNQLKKRCNK